MNKGIKIPDPPAPRIIKDGPTLSKTAFFVFVTLLASWIIVAVVLFINHVVPKF